MTVLKIFQINFQIVSSILITSPSQSLILYCLLWSFLFQKFHTDRVTQYGDCSGFFHLVVFKVTQSCLTLWDPMDYKVHEILHARILEWVAFPFSRGSFQPRDRTQVSSIVAGFFTGWATREGLLSPSIMFLSFIYVVAFINILFF